MTDTSVNHRKYVIQGKEKIAGWLSRIDAEIYYVITQYQNQHDIVGAIAEIGLHHGKSFIALCLALKNSEKAYGIDVFENQAANLDLSGFGNKEVLLHNLSLYKIDPSRTILDERRSEDVAPKEILDQVGDVRFFSIDGGHWFDVVHSDLKLAEKTVSDLGVIAIDDFLRPEWPDVSAAYFAWFSKRERPFVPFAIGFNKLYLCHENELEIYKKLLEQSYFLKNFLIKNYSFMGNVPIPIFTRYQLPEHNLFDRSYDYLRIYHPELYFYVGKSIKRIKKLLLPKGKGSDVESKY